MKQIATIFFSFLLVFTFFGTVEGQTFYTDDFSGEDDKGQIGATKDVAGVDWSIDVSGGSFSNSDDFFAVKSGVFETQDVDGNVIWFSESIDITGKSNIVLTIDAGANGDFEASSDIFTVNILIDGTPQTLLEGTVDENEPGDPIFFGSTKLTNSLQTFTETVSGTGSSAQIQITTNNNSGTELFRFDNLTLYETKAEPSNHVSVFSATANMAVEQINLSWTDATGSPAPDSYLIKVSDTDFTAITTPADGNSVDDDTNISDGLAAKNVEHGTESAVFTGLNESTLYYFKIFPYTNTGSVVDYKTDGTVPQTSETTLDTPDIILNEILSDPNGDANGDGVTDTGEDEFLEFVNIGTSDLDISNWTIEDANNTTHTFNSSTLLKPYQAIVVFGNGTPTGDFGGALTQTAGDLSLNNDGDDVILKNSSGVEILNISYSGSTNESETRSPDLTGTFEDHTTADTDDASVFSPGTRVDGSTFQPSVTFDDGEGWRMIASPTQNNSYDDLLFDLWTQGTSGTDYLGGEPNVMTYNSSTSSFTSVSNLETDMMVSGQGFIVYVYSDDDYDKSPTDAGFPKNLDLFGVPNSGSISAPLNSGSGTFSLVGNPYNEPIDWDELVTSDFDGTIYVYDHSYGSIDGGGDDEAETRNNVGGGYRTWNESGTGSLSGGIIAPFQGFWVESSVANPSLTFEESAQTTGGTFYTKENKHVISLRLKSEMENMFSEAFLSFTESGQLGDDKNDGLKLSPLDFRDYMSLSTEVEGTQMDINNLPVELYNPVEIPLHVQAFEAVESGWTLMGGEVTLSWPEMNNIPSEWEITLTDTQLNNTIDLKSTNQYVFEAEGSRAKIPGKEPFSPFNPKPFQKEKTVNDARFLITINPNVPDGLIDDNIPDQFTLEQNYPNPFNPTTNIKFEIAETSDVKLNVYNVMGQRVSTLVNEVKAPGTYEIAWDARDMASGIYYYRLRAGGVVFNRQMTLIK